MTKQGCQVLEDALKLSPLERAELVEQILTSFSFPDRQGIDTAWAVEVEDRIEAYEKGDIGSRSARDVFDRLE